MSNMYDDNIKIKTVTGFDAYLKENEYIFDTYNPYNPYNKLLDTNVTDNRPLSLSTYSHEKKQKYSYNNNLFTRVIFPKPIKKLPRFNRHNVNNETNVNTV